MMAHAVLSPSDSGASIANISSVALRRSTTRHPPCVLAVCAAQPARRCAALTFTRTVSYAPGPQPTRSIAGICGRRALHRRYPHARAPRGLETCSRAAAGRDGDSSGDGPTGNPCAGGFGLREREVGERGALDSSSNAAISKSSGHACGVAGTTTSEASGTAATSETSSALFPSASAPSGDISSPAAGPLGPDDIARRIAASRARRANRLVYNCPACTVSAATPINIARHMARCCPDLMQPDTAAWNQLESLPRGFPSPQHDLAVSLLRAAGAQEGELRRRVLTCVFWSGPTDPDTGLTARLAADEAARQLGLPLSRATTLLQRAMASVPLASDRDDPPLDVLYEDEHFLAVNKPVGLHTAPIHRFTGGSVVNKVIAYLNRHRGGRPTTQPLTLLTPGVAPTSPAAAFNTVPFGFLPPLMPVSEPFSLTSTSGSEEDDCGAGTVQSYQLEPYVLHRLDMNTSGLLLFAKRQEVVAGVHRQFRERTLSKLYVAAAVGCPAPAQDRFDVDAPIDYHPSQPVARIVASTGKEASTSFAVMARSPAADVRAAAGGAPGLLFHERSVRSGHATACLSPSASSAATGSLLAAAGASTVTDTSSRAALGSGTGGAYSAGYGAGAGDSGDDSGGPRGGIPLGASLVVCAPHSGRTHQIRVHLHHVGHPIVGDDIYGVTGPWLGRQALHAASLRFTHPLTGREMRLAAPLHDDMAGCLAALGLPQPDVGSLLEEWRELTEAGGDGSGGAGGKSRARRGHRVAGGGR